MPQQRKIFRIEELIGHMPAEQAPSETSCVAAHHAELMAELRALRTAIAQNQNVDRSAASAQTAQAPLTEARKLKIELDVIGEAIKQTKEEIVHLQDQGFDNSRITRVAGELDAIVSGTEQATNKILRSAEQIDEAARNLSAMLKSTYEKDLTQDIQDQVTQIFEACNFQDMTGQRIAKVVSTLTMVEDHLARMMEIWNVIERFNAEAVQSASSNLDGLLNGPKLEGDAGHSTQDEIDQFFH